MHKKETRLGGAANVAINLSAMGADPILCSVIGDDRNGDEMLRLMQELRMNTDGMVPSPDRVTTVKTRVIGNNHQLIRVDDEVLHELNDMEQEHLLVKVKTMLDQYKPQVVVFEDYDKGVLGEKVIGKIISYCSERKIPTAVDPKKKNSWHYRGVKHYLKPNLSELERGIED
ncbi:MAG: hypothetical protein IPM91_20365 [Bacteroidetes bacterium]|nr:hypothetical protein [Bacteroidota bacterium]